MKRLTVVVPLALAATFLFVVGRGIDFGQHWDEEALIDKVEWSVTTGGVLLPPTYDWPSASYWVAVAALLPEAALSGVSSSDLTQLERRLLNSLSSPRYLFRLRWMFATLTALTIVWVFLASRALGGAVSESSIAAAIVALAWEPAYHARFAVPDGLLMQFGALALWCTVMAARHDQSRWVWGAALVAGVAVGTKYSAWPLLVPVVWIAVRAVGSAGERARRVVLVGVTSIAGFLITTPGALLMPVRFVQAIVAQTRHYAAGHGAHTIARGWDHLWRMGEYLTLELLSANPAIAALITAAAVVGAVVMVRQNSRLAIALLAFPIAYVLYFSLQRVMIVRNLIVVAPFLAVAAARGLSFMASAPRTAVLRVVPYAVVAVALAVNAAFAWHAASTIRDRQNSDLAAAARGWIEQARGSRFGVSPAVSRAIGDDTTRATNVAEDAAEQWLTLSSEPVCGAPLPANVRGLIVRVAGPLEVNLTRYPDWSGDAHLVVVDLAKLRRYGRCTGDPG